VARLQNLRLKGNSETAQKMTDLWSAKTKADPVWNTVILTLQSFAVGIHDEGLRVLA
jgi:hypothetical protein